MSNRARIREEAKKLNPIDDIQFCVMAENREFCEEILRVILNDKQLEVLENISQNKIQNLQGRSVILDAKCKLGDGNIVNIEVQKSDNDDHQRRVRYNTSVLTANILDPGTKFEKVPDIISIYISKFDIFKLHQVVYEIERTIKDCGSKVYNGLKEVYITATIDDNSEVSGLMKVFTDNDTYDNRFPKTSEIKNRLKNTEGGLKRMCDIVEKLNNEAATKATFNTNLNNIKSLIETLKLTPQQALDALKIDVKDQPAYLEALS